MDPRKLSTEELVQLCLASRDEVVWAEFVRRFQTLIASVIVKCLFHHSVRPNSTLVDDLVQETYCKKICANEFKALRNFKFRHENALHGFLKVMAANVVEDYFRGLNSQKRGSGRTAEDLEAVQTTTHAASDFLHSVHRRIQVKEIEMRLQELAGEPNFARDSMIFWLYYRDGLTAQAISQLPEIELTVKGVESTLLRLIKWLRDKFK